MSQRRELLLLIMVEDAAKLFKLIGYSKVAEKLNLNLEKIYINGRPDTGPIREKLELPK